MFLSYDQNTTTIQLKYASSRKYRLFKNIAETYTNI